MESVSAGGVQKVCSFRPIYLRVSWNDTTLRRWRRMTLNS